MPPLVTSSVSPPPPPSPPPRDVDDVPPLETSPEAEGMSEDERIDRARELYAEAENLAHEGYWTEAAPLYIRALEIAPDVRRVRAGLAQRAGNAAWQAGDCDTAQTYLEYYLVHDDGSDAEQAEWARQTLREIELSNCASEAPNLHPARYWN